VDLLWPSRARRTSQAVCARPSSAFFVLPFWVLLGCGGLIRASHLLEAPTDPPRMCLGPQQPPGQRARGRPEPLARSITGAACGDAAPSLPLSETTACVPPIMNMPPAFLAAYATEAGGHTPPSAPPVLLHTCVSPARASFNLHAAGADRAPAACPSALRHFFPLLRPIHTPGPQTPTFVYPAAPTMTRQPEMERATERRRAQRRRH